MSENLDAIFRRIQKLLAIAEDARANPNEAAAAASQAEKIMRKYQIEQSDVIQKELESNREDSFGTTDLGAGIDQTKMNVGNHNANLSRLSVRIAQLNDAQARFVDDKIFGKMIRFQGYKPDVMICKFMFRYIVRHFQLAAKQNLDFSQGYQDGFFLAVCELLKEAKTQKDAENQATVGSRSLVIVKGDAVAKHFGEVNYSRSAARSLDGASAARGYADGKRMDVLRRGVGHTAAPSVKAIR